MTYITEVKNTINPLYKLICNSKIKIDIKEFRNSKFYKSNLNL